MREGLEVVAQRVTDHLLAHGGKLTEGGTEILFRCPLPVHDGPPHATWNPADGVWRCHSRGCDQAEGGGAIHLARLLGLDPERPLSEADTASLEARRREAEAAALERRQAAEEARQAAAGALADLGYVERCAAALARDAAALEAVYAYGIDLPTARHYRLGVDEYRGRRALVIPALARGQLRGVQYRMLDDGRPRYLFREGLPWRLWGADAILEPVDDQQLVVVEGAMKAACLYAHGLRSVVAIPSKGGWRREFVPLCSAFRRVVFALDPDARAEARAAARSLPAGRGRVVELPLKPDDLVLEVGMRTLRLFLARARPA